MSPDPAILIVDEDADSREMLRLSIARAGFAALTAADDGAAMVALRSSGAIVCVLLDLDGPHGHALRFRLAQRRDRSLAWIPVVAVSSKPDLRELGRQLDVACVLAKPLALDELTGAVREAAAAVILRRPR